MTNGNGSTALYLPPAKHDGARYIMEKLEVIKSRLPSSVNAWNFCSAIIQEANSMPGEVSRTSIAETAMNCAIVGLIPGKARKHAYFIAFGKTCQLVVGYQGFLDLAFGNSFLRSVYADVVLRDEEFDYHVDRSGPQLLHRPGMDRVETRESVLAAYCVYETHNGGHGVVVVYRSQLDKVDKKRDVWKSDYPAMAKKTAILRASKCWKTTPVLALAVELEEQAERGEVQRCEVEVSPEEPVSFDSYGREPGDESLADVTG